ncbi:MAG: indolepyruvate ferredoxin oxidoreductase subunit alpha [Eubacterium sp.]|nr:indolepyruvate ferredoxin oxidoreductase subunit alpha [Eubacterium sp.]
MHDEFLMGNAAIARGAIAAGLNLIAGYPGTPSTEVLENVAKSKREGTYVEWSVNEKAALEMAAGASYAGARTMVTMKQVGLNVATDPLMSLEYIGIKGGMIILVADDPGPISSQTEQDTRKFAEYSKLPCFDPSSVQEAYDMVEEAFALSEKYGTPVFLRSTTRVSHGYASIKVKDASEYYTNTPEGFIKDSKRWVIFPRLAFMNHKKIEERNALLSKVFSDYERNTILFDAPGAGDELGDVQDNVDENTKEYGIAAGGISYSYTLEAMKDTGEMPLFKVSTPFPFPEEKAVEFLKNKKEVLCIEELDPVIERALTYVCGKYHLSVNIRGKLTGDTVNAGENTIDNVKEAILNFKKSICMSGESAKQSAGAVADARESVEKTAGTVAESAGAEVTDKKEPPVLPVRPPVLCAGCPHRASFYAVKKAMQGRKTIFCGDIGCYTLGNAMPLDMVDTCLCMGAGVNIAQGVGHIEPDTKCFAFVGDSTFFASAITGVVNAVYNQADMTLIVLDNSTTAMTGHQPHPGTGRTMMGEIVAKINIEQVLRGIGLTTVETINPLEYEASVELVKRVAAEPGVKAIIFKSPCVAIVPQGKPLHIDQEKCIKCRKCIREIGCPGIVINDGRVEIDTTLCTGCTLCSQLCPVGAIQ